MGPILLFILIPLWQYICTPIIRRLFSREVKPLHSVTAGGVCSALSFICAGVLQEYINVSMFSIYMCMHITIYYIFKLVRNTLY